MDGQKCVGKRFIESASKISDSRTIFPARSQESNSQEIEKKCFKETKHFENLDKTSEVKFVSSIVITVKRGQSINIAPISAVLSR